MPVQHRVTANRSVINNNISSSMESARYHSHSKPVSLTACEPLIHSISPLGAYTFSVPESFSNSQLCCQWCRQEASHSLLQHFIFAARSQSASFFIYVFIYFLTHKAHNSLQPASQPASQYLWISLPPSPCTSKSLHGHCRCLSSEAPFFISMIIAGHGW